MSDRYEMISIEQCVHYCGFLYGSQSKINPYQDYLYHFHRGESKKEVRDRFIRFLLSYRPRNMAEALTINLTKEYPLWQYPWDHPSFSYPRKILSRLLHLTRNYMKPNQTLNNRAEKSPKKTDPPWAGWIDDPLDIPDILTHFSSNGIYMFKIEQEFVWLERAYYSIREKGYEPNLADNPIEAIKLISGIGERKFIITDGNHRISSLYSLGKLEPLRCRITNEVYEEDLQNWHQVKAGLFTRDDARKIFSLYFVGNELNYYSVPQTEQIMLLGADFKGPNSLGNRE
jgi:hypothetical protein